MPYLSDTTGAGLREREDELACLNSLLEECRGGRERVAVITGEVGIGKTKLMNTFAEGAIAIGAIYCDATAARQEQALQLGVISQLFLSAGFPADVRERAARLLETGVLRTQGTYSTLGDTGTDKLPPHIAHEISTLLLELTERTNRPLLLTIDDAHHADPSSLACLASVIGRLRRARVMVVISSSAGPQPFSPNFLADLPPEPFCRYIRLRTLTKSAVEAMLADQLTASMARRLAAECHRISGGNPILVRALIDDYLHGVTDPQCSRLLIGNQVIQGILGILHKSDLAMLFVARWVAILGESGKPSVVGILAGLDCESAARTLAALERTGVLEDGMFRHPGLQAAVLAGLTPEQQAEMHAQAAEVLRFEGAATPVIADHLVAAEGQQEAWQLSVLNAAAGEALASGKVARALRYLGLAHRLPAVEPHRSAAEALLMRAEWRIDQALVMRHGAEVTPTAKISDAQADWALTAVSHLMWFGRADDARVTLQHIRALGTSLDQPSLARLDALQAWFSWLFPATARAAGATRLADQRQRGPTVPCAAGQAIALLASVVTEGAEESVTAAESILHECTLEERTLVLIAAALAVLICTGRLSTAEQWCDALQQDAAGLETPTWQGLFAAIRAVIAMRQGDPPAAENYARTALSHIPASSWGIFIGVPVSILVQATTAMGRYEEAATYLRIPVPDALFETPISLLYLQARGHFHYMRGHFRIALEDFITIGKLSTAWQMDFPVMTSWRTSAALSCLGLGQVQHARELVNEQLKKLAPGNTRERGISLRVLAACSDLPLRAHLLRQAARALERSGDRLELALALADLCEVYQALGEKARARRISRRAEEMTRQYALGVPAGCLVPDPAGEAPADGDCGSSQAGTGRPNGLTEAERRVAALAADGFSNRQIADKLFITVSTVEQHLTRVYSKLNVSRRSDLPFGLQLDVYKEELFTGQPG